MEAQKKIRNSNLELLRIISMVLIIAHHYAVHGFSTIEMSYSFNQYIVEVLSLGGKLGVACFILISGYFMVEMRFTLHKLIKLAAEVWFYSFGLGILFIFVFTPVYPMGIKAVIKAVIKAGVPIGYNVYWFMTHYIMLMVISPALNIVIHKIDRKFYRAFLFLFIILWSIIPFFTKAGYGYNVLGWFVILYFIAGYVKKYVDTEKRNSAKHFAVAMLSYFMVILSNVLFAFFGHFLNNNFLTLHRRDSAALNSPFILLVSVELLLGFIKRKPYQSLWINKMASAALGVYLIHDNGIFRPYLWQKIMRNAEMYQSKFLIIHALLSIAGIYIVCSLIDLLRQATVEKLFLAVMNQYFEGFKKKLCKMGEVFGKNGQKLMEWYDK